MLIGMAKLGGLFLRTCEKVMMLLRYGDWNMAEGGGQYQLFFEGGGWGLSRQAILPKSMCDTAVTLAEKLLLAFGYINRSTGA